MWSLRKSCTFALANEKQQLFNCKQHGTLAQVVEQWTENPCVLGSTPRGTTSSFHSNPVIGFGLCRIFLCHDVSGGDDLQGRALCPSATRMANKLSMPTHWLRTGPNHPYPPLHVGRDTSFTTRAYQSSTMPISAATSSALTLPVSKMPTQELLPDDRATISFIVSPFCFTRMLMPSLLPFFMPVNSL